MNPYDEQKRQSQMGILTGQPVSTTMPVGRGPSAFEGFDFTRPQDIKKSAKDSFAHHSKLAGPAPIHDKAALGQWAQQHVVPGMNADGHGVSSVTGDKLRFKNWQGEYDVDFGRGAGADGGALAWQAEDVNAPQGDAAAIAQSGAPMGVVNPAGDNSALARIMAELTAASDGEDSPAAREAMLAMLQGI